MNRQSSSVLAMNRNVLLWVCPTPKPNRLSCLLSVDHSNIIFVPFPPPTKSMNQNHQPFAFFAIETQALPVDLNCPAATAEWPLAAFLLPSPLRRSHPTTMIVVAAAADLSVAVLMLLPCCCCYWMLAAWHPYHHYS